MEGFAIDSPRTYIIITANLELLQTLCYATVR